jgi:hypothetical protein
MGGAADPAGRHDVADPACLPREDHRFYPYERGWFAPSSLAVLPYEVLAYESLLMHTRTHSMWAPPSDTR